MAYLHSTHERRRRMLGEEQPTPAKDAAAEADAAGSKKLTRKARKLERYLEAARMDKQPRVTDFIPMRPYSLVVRGLLALTVVAGLEFLYVWLPTVFPWASAQSLQAFDLARQGSLATWFSSMTLALASLVALLIYSLRRQKSDDYRGRYRVWLWAALCCMVMGIDETAGLRYGYRSLMVYLTQHHLLGGGDIWWVGSWAIVLGIVGTLLTIEVWSCRFSTTLLLIAGCLWSVASLIQLGWLLEASQISTMIASACVMTSHVVALLALATHARYTMLDVQSLLPKKNAKPKPAKATPPTKSKLVEGIAKIDPAHKTTTPANKRTDLETQTGPKENKPHISLTPAKASPAPAADDDLDDDDDDSEDGDRRSTRADRKRLRKNRGQGSGARS